MEEIVTVDGKQFKLTVDRPLTAQERAQTLAEIRKQSCGTCGPRTTPRTMAMSGRSGKIRSLEPTCTRTTFAEGETIYMSAAPDGGTGPYSVSFYYNIGAGDVPVGTTQTDIAEGATATQELDVTETMVRDANFTTAGTMQLKTTVTDSCPLGAETCTETCVVGAVCVAPTCNFVVT